MMSIGLTVCIICQQHCVSFVTFAVTLPHSHSNAKAVKHLRDGAAHRGISKSSKKRFLFSWVAWTQLPPLRLINPTNGPWILDAY